MSFPAGYVDGRSVKWQDLRFGGSLGGACVLWASRMRSVVVVADTAVRPLGPYIEPVSTDSWYQRLWDRLTRSASVYTLDATSFPGGVALLFSGRSAGAGRMVDLYSDSGAYLQTMVLPRSALRVAGNRERLYVLSQHRDSILLASYILPWSLRSRMPPVDTHQVESGPPAGVPVHTTRRPAPVAPK